MTEAGLKYWEKILEYNTKNAESDRAITSLLKLRENKIATYKDAEDFSKAVSSNWSKSLQKFLGANAEIPVGVTADDIEEMVSGAMAKSYKTVAYYSSDAEAVLLKDAKVGIKPITTSIDRSRIKNMIKKLRDTAEGDVDLINDENDFLLDDYTQETVARSAVNDTIAVNSDFQTKAGLKVTIERDIGAGCCDWCNSMAGIYEYGTEPSNFYQVHSACTCTFRKRVGKTLESVMHYDKSGSRKLIKF